MLTDEQRALAEENFDLVFATARHYARFTPFEYEDLVSLFSEVLVTAAQTFDHTKKTKFKTYASHAMKYRLINLYKKRPKTTAVSFEELTQQFDTVTPWEKYTANNYSSIEDIVIRKLTILKVLRNFKGTQRQKAAAIMLVRNPYLPNVKIASLTGMSPSSVNIAVKEFRKQLKAEMTG